MSEGNEMKTESVFLRMRKKFLRKSLEIKIMNLYLLGRRSSLCNNRRFSGFRGDLCRLRGVAGSGESNLW